MKPTEEAKKKDTVRISKKDLLKMLSENEQQAKQIKDLQDRCNQYLEEVRDLKKKLQDALIKKAMDSVREEIQHNPMPVHPFGPDIYIDGASKFGR
jgi:hypothetical protein